MLHVFMTHASKAETALSLCLQGTAGPPQRHVLPGVPGAHVRGCCAGSGLEALLHTQQSHGGLKVRRGLTIRL